MWRRRWDEYAQVQCTLITLPGKWVISNDIGGNACESYLSVRQVKSFLMLRLFLFVCFFSFQNPVPLPSPLTFFLFLPLPSPLPLSPPRPVVFVKRIKFTSSSSFSFSFFFFLPLRVELFPRWFSLSVISVFLYIHFLVFYDFLFCVYFDVISSYSFRVYLFRYLFFIFNEFEKTISLSLRHCGWGMIISFRKSKNDVT